MSTFPETSDRRCPYDGKLMFVDVGQDAAGIGGHGWVELWHECWSCDYRELDTQWKRTPVLELVRTPTRSGLSAAQRLRAMRDGEVIPMRLDLPAVVPSDFDEEVRT